jgi:hypothetical protein
MPYNTSPDSIVVTGPNFEQISADKLLVTATSGSQVTLAQALAGLGVISSPTIVGGTINNAPIGQR